MGISLSCINIKCLEFIHKNRSHAITIENRPKKRVLRAYTMHMYMSTYSTILYITSKACWACWVGPLKYLVYSSHMNTTIVDLHVSKHSMTLLHQALPFRLWLICNGLRDPIPISQCFFNLIFHHPAIFHTATVRPKRLGPSLLCRTSLNCYKY